MGNVPKAQRIAESQIVEVIQRAREDRKPIVASLMEEFGLLEHQAKYHYSKVTLSTLTMR